ncbi:hypothetical protein [Paracoccus endophyticus]|uniref:hypothetical protein n=1 Tax=Paracoccus endophyticus TaxID=2233774 RepID=UPI0013A6A9F1|nr:hypothetical protein [Paracoccus endophyticus]
MSLLLTVPAAAQQGTGAPLPADSMAPDAQTVPPDSLPSGSVGDSVDNPHSMLGELTGGPDGSPTALRGNPLPGTSTSIPTANPAPVIPLPEREGKAAERETTGIEGQCDPVVGLGNCPDRPSATNAEAGEGAGASASAVEGAGAASSSAGNGEDDVSVPPPSGTTNGGAIGTGGATN